MTDGLLTTIRLDARGEVIEGPGHHAGYARAARREQSSARTAPSSSA
jgi:hypothetical protein